MDQLGQKFKTDFLPFLKWLFFQIKFGAQEFLKSDVVFSRYDNFTDEVVTDW